MNAASGLEIIEAAKVHEPPVVAAKDSFDNVIQEEEFEYPTEEELRTLRRVSGQIPWSAYTIAFVELCERFSYYGTTAVCMSRIPDVMSPSNNQQSSTSSSNLSQKEATPVLERRANLVPWEWVNAPQLV